MYFKSSKFFPFLPKTACLFISKEPGKNARYNYVKPIYYYQVSKMQDFLLYAVPTSLVGIATTKLVGTPVPTSSVGTPSTTMLVGTTA